MSNLYIGAKHDSETKIQKNMADPINVKLLCLSREADPHPDEADS
jgi:hypothetical protein